MSDLLVKALRETVEKQNREDALGECFKGWDGEYSLETILHGFLGRFKACGINVKGIRVKRINLKTLVITLKGKGDITFRFLPYTGSYIEEVNDTGIDLFNFFDITSLRNALFWLNENFYH